MALLLVPSPRAGAQAPPPKEAEDLTSLSLEELMEVEIVYSASRRQQNVREAPSRVTIITAAEIRQFGYRTLADALRSVAGFYTWNDRNYQYLGIRGFGRPGDFNSRVLVLVDGHKTNDNVYDSALIENGFTVDVDMIERLEVVRGPSSSIYGTGAFYPVLVNVVTRRGDSVSAELSGEAASFGTYQGRASWGGRVGGGPELTLSGSLLSSHGQDLYFPEFDAPETNHGVALNADGERADHVFGNLSWGPFTLQAAHSSRDKTLPTAPYGTLFGDTRTRTTDERTYVDAMWDATLSPRLRLVARARYDRSSYRGVYPNGTAPTVLNRDETLGDAFGLDSFATYTGIQRHTISFGVDAQYNPHLDQKNYDIAPRETFLDEKDSSGTWGVYLEDEVRLGKGAILSAGARFDRFFSRTRLSPRLALVLSPLPSTDVKLILGQSARPPNAYEREYRSVSPLQLPNPDLRPEAFKTAELVVERRFARDLRLAASAFVSRIDGLISLVTLPEDGALQYQNADTIDSTGVELESSCRFSALSVRASYSYQETTSVSTGSRLSNSPRHLGKLNLAAAVLPEQLTAGLEAQYTGPRRSLLGNDAGGFLLLNATVVAHPLSPHLELSGSVYNLLDRSYAEPGGPEHVEDLIPQDGRSFRLKLTLRF